MRDQTPVTYFVQFCRDASNLGPIGTILIGGAVPCFMALGFGWLGYKVVKTIFDW